MKQIPAAIRIIWSGAMPLGVGASEYRAVVGSPMRFGNGADSVSGALGTDWGRPRELGWSGREACPMPKLGRRFPQSLVWGSREANHDERYQHQTRL